MSLRERADLVVKGLVSEGLWFFTNDMRDLKLHRAIVKLMEHHRAEADIVRWLKEPDPECRSEAPLALLQRAEFEPVRDSIDRTIYG